MVATSRVKLLEFVGAEEEVLGHFASGKAATTSDGHFAIPPTKGFLSIIPEVLDPAMILASHLH